MDETRQDRVKTQFTNKQISIGRKFKNYKFGE